MGIYLNPGNDNFYKAVNSEIYVDKTGLIKYTNKVLNTQQQYICVSRPRRFGKSMAANMLAAYYSRGCDSQELFADYEIGKDTDFATYLNKYDVIFINMQDFLSRTQDVAQMLELLKSRILWELLRQYPDCNYFDKRDLISAMQDVYENTRTPFVIIIDEWDCVLRVYRDDFETQKVYLDFLRDFLKDKGYIHLAYMTGILPIKKYGTHSALNMFAEFSMTNPRQLAEYVGFTETEVCELCDRYHMNMEELKEWYDGYQFANLESVYSPRSVVEAVISGICDTYWNQTETFEALRMYIDMNFEGLKEDVLSMMAGERLPINVGSFTNDMTTFHSEDDVLTLLIHLGYLGYDFNNKCVFIPNNEVRMEYANAVSVSEWGEVSRVLKNSADILNAIWNQNEVAVSKGIEQAHFETSHLQYNDENALSYTISLALYAARNFYTVYRELPTGKGFADLVFIPRKNHLEKPAMIVELKWDKTAIGAIAQMKDRNYVKALEDYTGNLLLVGINYDVKSKEHECVIEEYVCG